MCLCDDLYGKMINVDDQCFFSSRFMLTFKYIGNITIDIILSFIILIESNDSLLCFFLVKFNQLSIV